MYFLRVRPLKEQLAREGLSEKDRFHYLLAWTVLSAGLTTGAAGQVSVPFLPMLVIGIAGAYWAYSRNGGSAGTGLFDRYFSIGFVVQLRVVLVILALGALILAMGPLRDALDNYAALLGFAGSDPETEEGMGSPAWSNLLGVLAGAYVAWSIGRHIGDIRAASGAGASVPLGATVSTLPAAQPGPAAHLVQARSQERLDHLVERVIQSEIQAGTAVTAGAPGRSRVRVLRPRKRASARSRARGRARPRRPR